LARFFFGFHGKSSPASGAVPVVSAKRR
jgi:hypothetical protein